MIRRTLLTKDWLCFTALESGTFTLALVAALPTSDYEYVEYSIDEGKTWTRTNNVNSTEVTVTTPTISAGKRVFWRGKGLKLGTGTADTACSRFSSTCNYKASGSVMSLFGEEYIDTDTWGVDYALTRLFHNDTHIVTPPRLPITNFYPMGEAQYIYSGMFYGCTALTVAPELPATVLSTGCYQQMFQRCTALTKAPVLPATTLVSKCYNAMFRGCTSVNYIKAMFTTTPSTSYCSGWVANVASSGTFVKNSAATWDVTGTSGIPSGWTVQTASS